MTLRALHGTSSHAVLRVGRRNVSSLTARSRISLFTAWARLQQISTVIVGPYNTVLRRLFPEHTDISAIMDYDALYDTRRHNFSAKHVNRLLAQYTSHWRYLRVSLESCTWASCPSGVSGDALQNACGQRTCLSYTSTSSFLRSWTACVPQSKLGMTRAQTVSMRAGAHSSPQVATMQMW